MTSLSDESRKAVDEYLQKLEEKLGELPDDERADAVAETRSHIEEAVARIQEDEAAAVGTVLRGLGEPEAFAEGLLSGEPKEEASLPPQPASVTPAPDSAQPKRPFTWGWCLVGCVVVPVLVTVAALAIYFATFAVTIRSAVHHAMKEEDLQQQAVMAEEMGMLESELLDALQGRDVDRLTEMLHPELVAESGVTGEDLLMPEGAGEMTLREMAMPADDSIRVTVSAGEVKQRYTFRRHDIDWRIRDFQRDAAP